MHRESAMRLLMLAALLLAAGASASRPFISACMPPRPDILVPTVVAIDVGSTNSHVAVYKDGNVRLINPKHGNVSTSPWADIGTPSWVALDDSDAWIFGEEAREYGRGHPERAIFGLLNLIGRWFDDPEVKSFVKSAPFRVVERESVKWAGQPVVALETRNETLLLSPEEIMGKLLRYLKEMAEAEMGEVITEAIIPHAYIRNRHEVGFARSTPWEMYLRTALGEACRLAGLHCHFMDRHRSPPCALDFDVFEPSTPGDGSAAATASDASGGRHLPPHDARSPENAAQPPNAARSLLVARSPDAARSLHVARSPLVARSPDANGRRTPPEDTNYEALVVRVGGASHDVTFIDHLRRFSDVNAHEGGGRARIGGENFTLRIQDYFLKLIKERHGRDLRTNISALHKLRGLAEWAKRALSTQEQVTVEVPNLAEGVDFSETLTRAQFVNITRGLVDRIMASVLRVLSELRCAFVHDRSELFLVGGGSKMPEIERRLLEELSGKVDYCSRCCKMGMSELSGVAGQSGNRSTTKLVLRRGGVDEEEVGAFGAAAAAPLYFEHEPEILQMYFTLNTLGIATSNEEPFLAILPFETILPSERSWNFTTSQDLQTTVAVQVFARYRTAATTGESQMPTSQRWVGGFNLSGVPPLAQGVPQIKVTFRQDECNNLTVTAEVLGTGPRRTVVFPGDNDVLWPDAHEPYDESKEWTEEEAQQDRELKRKWKALLRESGAMNYFPSKTGAPPHPIKMDILEQAWAVRTEWKDRRQMHVWKAWETQLRDVKDLLPNAVGPPEEEAIDLGED